MEVRREQVQIGVLRGQSRRVVLFVDSPSIRESLLMTAEDARAIARSLERMAAEAEDADPGG